MTFRTGPYAAAEKVTTKETTGQRALKSGGAVSSLHRGCVRRAPRHAARGRPETGACRRAAFSVRDSLRSRRPACSQHQRPARLEEPPLRPWFLESRSLLPLTQPAAPLRRLRDSPGRGVAAGAGRGGKLDMCAHIWQMHVHADTHRIPACTHVCTTCTHTHTRVPTCLHQRVCTTYMHMCTCLPPCTHTHAHLPAHSYTHALEQRMCTHMYTYGCMHVQAPRPHTQLVAQLYGSQKQRPEHTAARERPGGKQPVTATGVNTCQGRKCPTTRALMWGRGHRILLEQERDLVKHFSNNSTQHLLKDNFRERAKSRLSNRYKIKACSRPQLPHLLREPDRWHKQLKGQEGTGDRGGPRCGDPGGGGRGTGTRREQQGWPSLVQTQTNCFSHGKGATASPKAASGPQ